MIDLFIIKLILAFIVGALWVTGATMLAEKFGSKIGGVILGLPSVALIGLFFIGWTQSATIAAEATTVVPISMGIIMLFISIYIVLSRYNFYLAITVSLLSWFLASLSLVTIHFNSLAWSLVGFAFFFVCSYVFVEKILKVASHGKKKMPKSISQMLIRALLSGSIVAVAVVMTKLGGPIWGGIFASFPGITLATIIVTYMAHGRDFSIAVSKTLMISGPLNVMIYALFVRYFYLSLGLVWGTIAAFAISLLTSYITYLYINKRMS